MSDTSDPLPEHADEAELFRTLALAERLMAPREEGGTAALPAAAAPSAGKTWRYWLWRAGGRKLARGDAAQVAANYEREMARRLEALRAENDKALARERSRVAELEKLTEQLRQAVTAEMEKLQRRMAAVRPADPAELTHALARATEAEERARLAENKVEMLKEALEITRARAGMTDGAKAPDDSRFREVKRTFARRFHPDHGGRGDDGKQRAFLEFWPELERIERGE